MPKVVPSELTSKKRKRSKPKSGSATKPGDSRRLSLHAVKELEDWLAEHSENPYPTQIEKESIAEE